MCARTLYTTHINDIGDNNQQNDVFIVFSFVLCIYYRFFMIHFRAVSGDLWELGNDVRTENAQMHTRMGRDHKQREKHTKTVYKV